MGYTTEFEGHINVSPPLNEHEISYLKDFNHTRRMKRTKGPLFIDAVSQYGQGDPFGDVLDQNRPDSDQPGLWCQWRPSDDGTRIEWDGGEKFYYAAEWMEYILNNLLAPSAKGYLAKHMSEDARLAHFTCDHSFSGRIECQGEEEGDKWAIEVETV